MVLNDIGAQDVSVGAGGSSVIIDVAGIGVCWFDL